MKLAQFGRVDEYLPEMPSEVKIAAYPIIKNPGMGRKIVLGESVKVPRKERQ